MIAHEILLLHHLKPRLPPPPPPPKPPPPLNPPNLPPPPDQPPKDPPPREPPLPPKTSAAVPSMSKMLSEPPCKPPAALSLVSWRSGIPPPPPPGPSSRSRRLR